MLTKDAEPYCVTTAHRVPVPLQSAVKTELERMEAMGITERITEPTTWCSSKVPAFRKNVKIRICVDLKRLNKSVAPENHTLPILDDILHRLARFSVFSKLDAASGFWLIPLADESAKLTIFITPFGWYCFRRLLFGITSAPDIFQRKMEDILHGLPGVEVIMDDILVHWVEEAEHCVRLERALNKIKASGLRLNRQNCLFRQPQLEYMGHIICKDGISPNPKKVTAIFSRR